MKFLCRVQPAHRNSLKTSILYKLNYPKLCAVGHQGLTNEEGCWIGIPTKNSSSNEREKTASWENRTATMTAADVWVQNRRGTASVHTLQNRGGTASALTEAGRHWLARSRTAVSGFREQTFALNSSWKQKTNRRAESENLPSLLLLHATWTLRVWTTPAAVEKLRHRSKLNWKCHGDGGEDEESRENVQKRFGLSSLDGRVWYFISRWTELGSVYVLVKSRVCVTAGRRSKTLTAEEEARRRFGRLSSQVYDPV